MDGNLILILGVIFTYCIFHNLSKFMKNNTIILKIILTTIKIPLSIPLGLIFIFLFVITSICGAILTLMGFEIQEKESSYVAQFLEWYIKEFMDDPYLKISLFIIMIGIFIYAKITEQ